MTILPTTFLVVPVYAMLTCPFLSPKTKSPLYHLISVPHCQTRASKFSHHFFTFSLLVASSNNPLSTSLAGKCTYLTTLPLIKTFFTELRWGYFVSSRTVMSSSLMLRYWSTDFRVPRMEMSFLSSTVIWELVKVLKKLKNNMV